MAIATRCVSAWRLCSPANLIIRERLDLFIKVCQAIQHAHQKAIIQTTARHRSADTLKLLHQRKGVLDWIVMKHLEKP